jgi:AraC-like DNA-binding protein
LASLDAALSLGTPVTTVARDFGFSESSIYRHSRRHLSQSILRESRASRDTGTVDLLEDLLDVHHDLRAARLNAMATGAIGTLIRSADADLRAIDALLNRLGVNGSSETVALLRDGERVARAVAAATKEHPEVGGWIANQLQEVGLSESADALRRMAAVAAIVNTPATANTATGAQQ